MENKYELFVEHFRELLLAVTGTTEDKVYLKQGENSVEEDRLFIECARKGGVCQVCALHTKELYDYYCKGTSLEELVHNSVDGMDFMKKEGIFHNALNMENYDLVKDELFIRLLNWERNQLDLQDAVYRRMGDIALVLYLRIGEVEGCLTSLKIRKPLIRKWGQDEYDVFEKALVNTYFMSPPRIFQWEKLLDDPAYAGENFMNLCEDYLIYKGRRGNCLSTTTRTNGAAAIFLPGVARRLAYLMQEDLYIVFTSIHEAMIHNAKMADVDILRSILHDTVEEATPDEDFLTYQIYHYDRETEQFTCVPE